MAGQRSSATLMPLRILSLCLCLCLAAAHPFNAARGASPTFSAASQSSFAVNSSALGLPFEPPSSYAGSVPTSTRGHAGNALFFWGFERTPGSLAGADGPWMIWLNGGPGASSMLGLLLENGPIHVADNNTLFENEQTWQRLTDIIYVDQPVGIGYSTVVDGGAAATENEVAEDFVGFLSNFVSIFPHLRSRPLYLAGESFAGTYIPYIARAILDSKHPPVKLAKLALGDSTISNRPEYRDLPTTTIIKTYPQLIGYDTSVFEFYQKQADLCGYNITLEYPSPEPYPTLEPAMPSLRNDSTLNLFRRDATLNRLRNVIRDVKSATPAHNIRRDSSAFLDGRPSDEIDPWYGCFLLDSLLDYAVNFTFPWTLGAIDVYDIPDGGETLPIPDFLFEYINLPSVQEAIHAPEGATWLPFSATPFGPENGQNDNSPPAITFISELTSKVPILFYSGNDDADVSHRGTELAIQNMTFGGIRGFTSKPSTPWFDDNGVNAGIVHNERGVQYVLVLDSGHQVPLFAPQRALILLREFILGDNMNGTVTTSGRTIGGESAAYQKDYVRGPDAIFYPSGSTTSSTVWPSATIAAWDDFIARVDSPTDGGNIG